ncbi:MAG: EAL domain-containing protein [bacterium]|jgi:diguanylate cyclase (GGDEF)-like protein/PAS domain S-box-containing protein|nr:EAL domain-containing protein [bacterium]
MEIDRSIASLPIGVFETDINGRLTSANDAFRVLALGGGSITQGAAPWVNAQPAERSLAEAAWQRARENSTPFTFEFRLWKPDGEVMWVHVSTQPQLGTNSTITGYVGTAHDVTDAVVKRVLSEQLVGLLDVTADAVLVFDQHGVLMFCNDGARELIGVNEQSGLNDAAAQMFIQAIRDQVPREVTTSSTSNRWEGELGFRSPDGIMRTLSIVLQIVRTADGVISHYSAIARDITEAKQLQDELTRQATHDAMTGLPNRVLFLRKLSEALERSRTLKRGVTVLFVDLDKLKDVNDNIGHGVGDQLLNTIAKRLVSATRPSDIVARIGGDEFVVLCDGLGDEHVAMDVADRVRQAMTGQVILQGIEIFTSASIGIAMATPALLAEESPNDAAVTLLRNADTAMYRAKQRGRGRCEMFSEEMRKTDRDRAALSSELERALATNQLFVVHQPIVSTHTGRVAGTEALLRWNHPERGVLTPPVFLEMAEESGAIGPIGDWVIRQACTDARSWMDTNVVDGSFIVHVNVSARQLSDSGFVERVMGSLKDTKLEPSHLALEINETTMLNDNPAIMRTLNALKRLGVKLAIDDFGTGYSSLAHLRDFPADFLKLDGTLVRDIGLQGSDDPIVRSIIQLAHSLNMSVIAEWVTTDDQTQRLRLLGCDFVQGNRIGEPVVASEFAPLVQSRSTHH